MRPCMNFIFTTIIFLAILGCQSLSFSKNKTAYLNQGNQFAKDGLFKEAASNYHKELKINPNQTSALRNLGIVYLKMGNYKKSITYLKKSLHKFSNDYLTNFFIAESYRALNEHTDAIYYYRKTLDLKTGYDKAIKALSWSYYQTRNYNSALKTIGLLNKVTPEDSQAAVITARILIKLGDTSKALEIIQKSLAFSAPSESPYLNSAAGDAYSSANDCNNAQKSYRSALEQEPLLAGALLGLGKCMIKNGNNINSAISYLERATRLKPELVEGYFYLAEGLKMEKDPRSYKYYNLFYKKAANNPEYKIQLVETQKILSSTNHLFPERSNISKPL